MESEVDLAIARIAEANHGVFAAHHLREFKTTERERRHRLEVGRWESPYDRVYRIVGAPRSWRGDLLAACWAGGTGAVASHRSAAALWELPGSRQEIAEITCPRWRRAQHDGLVVHETRALSERDVTIVDQIPVTTVERTIFDLAAVCSRFTIDLAFDSALRRKLTTLEALRAMLSRVGRRGLKGTRLVRELLADRDARYIPTESEREQMLLRVLREHGLPEPERQFSIYDDAGTFLARPDLVYRDLKIAMEYDSYQHHVGKEALVRDSRRRNAIAAIGWLALVATAEDVRYGRGAQFAADVRKSRRTRELASPVDI
jgi:hypothetical protein